VLGDRKIVEIGEMQSSNLNSVTLAFADGMTEEFMREDVRILKITFIQCP
jgi:hypothetical protein